MDDRHRSDAQAHRQAQRKYVYKTSALNTSAGELCSLVVQYCLQVPPDTHVIIVEGGVEVGAAVVLLQSLLSDNASPDLSTLVIPRHANVDIDSTFGSDRNAHRAPAAMQHADQTVVCYVV